MRRSLTIESKDANMNESVSSDTPATGGNGMIGM